MENSRDYGIVAVSWQRERRSIHLPLFNDRSLKRDEAWRRVMNDSRKDRRS